MECILEANPGPEIRWYRGDTAIEETTPRYKMERKKTGRDQYTLTLTIRAPTQEDGGQYRCNAVNSFGESNANIALNFAGKFSWIIRIQTVFLSNPLMYEINYYFIFVDG